jgi:hypothetical protein
VDTMTGRRSTHTFLMYLTDCEQGGETILLKDLKRENRQDENEVLALAKVQPRRGRLLLFPHLCPHEGLPIRELYPKVLVRGEVSLLR